MVPRSNLTQDPCGNQPAHRACREHGVAPVEVIRRSSYVAPGAGAYCQWVVTARRTRRREWWATHSSTILRLIYTPAMLVGAFAGAALGDALSSLWTGK